MPHVVIVGGGFGGLTTAQALARAPVKVTLIDKTNHHLFQPLLYQVASAGLSPADIATPIRAVLSSQRNAHVALAEVVRVDVDRRRVVLKDGELSYDFLVVAAGAQTSYFGHADWEAHAPGLKNLEDALEVRRRVLLAFERAERESNAETRRALLTFVVIGGGATGVEMAGALAELSRFVLTEDFRAICLLETRVILLEAGSRLLPAFPEDISQRGETQLVELGVSVRRGARVTSIDARGVSFTSNETGAEERVEAATVVWGAGVASSPLAKSLGAKLDRHGRVCVGEDCSIAGHPEVFVIGDMAYFEGRDGKPLPGLCPVAMQQGRSVAKNIEATLAGKARKPFSYVDKGNMATVGRSRAVAKVGKLHLSGVIAWLAWLFVHVVYLIGFRNRIVVLVEWFWSYFTYSRRARLITGTRTVGSAAGARSEIDDDAKTLVLSRSVLEEMRARHATRRETR